jgi:hypothetical protein
MNSDERFPAFRKYAGIDTWFKITGERNFTEIRKIGTRLVKTEVHATQFPEIQLIRDMLDCYEGRWEIISAHDFECVSGTI